MSIESVVGTPHLLRLRTGLCAFLGFRFGRPAGYDRAISKNNLRLPHLPNDQRVQKITENDRCHHDDRKRVRDEPSRLWPPPP